MKNIKLLLATTAILSMGALAANAVSSDTVEVSVKLFPMTTVEVTQQPDLGVLTVLGENMGSSYKDYIQNFGLFSANESGKVVSSDSSKAMVVKQTTNGKLNVSCSVLDPSVFGPDVYIKNSSEESMFAVRYKCVDDEYNKAEIILSYIGGAWSNLQTFLENGGGEATGSFTVTTVY